VKALGILLLAVLAGLTLGSAAEAAFPGQNGKIVLQEGGPYGWPYGISTVNPNSTGRMQLTQAGEPWPNSDQEPAWSPDGQRIAFARGVHGATDIWVMNADGSGQVRLTPDDSHDHLSPAWTSDGSQILWSSDASGTFDIWRMNADGSSPARVGGSETQDDSAPTPSPDGGRIAFAREGQIRTMDSDGTNENLLGDGRRPDWSPDGAHIVFQRYVRGPMYPCQWDPETEPFDWDYPEIFRMDAEGGAVTQLTDTEPGDCFVAQEDYSPVWSPDGSKLLWSSQVMDYYRENPPHETLNTMNPDGGNQQAFTSGWQPDWQPVQPGYVRPKSATLVRASLVPAYIQCTSPNRTHGPPLAFPSCSPPQERSGVLTAGTPEVNGSQAGLAGSVRIKVEPGTTANTSDDADIAATISITDVRCRTANAACPGGAGSDYEGKLAGVLTALRITDRLNTPPGPDGVPGTASGVLEMPVQCTATASTSTGATCSLSTTLDALLPGAVREGKRSVWELGQIHVRDAGPNGTGYESSACPPDCGDGDETLFLRQGVFVP
jgi:dipeptidyl aminopeptidase/acylaminoacyl peptidase